MNLLAGALLFRLSSAWNCSYEALASLPSDLVKNSLDIDKLAGEWYEQSFHDFAQVGSRCQRFHFRTVSDSIESNFSVIYGARIPFFIREHYRPPPAPTHMRGIFAKWVSIPGGIPGGSLLQLPSAIVDVAMTAGGEAESLSIYSCLAGLKVLKIATRSRDAPDTVVEQLVQRAISRGVDLEHESMTRVRHSDCPAWVPSTVGVESMMV